MSIPVYWMPGTSSGRLGIMARPRGHDWLDDDLRALAIHGVDTLVSLLTEAEEWELGLTEEADSCVRCMLTFCAFPIVDRHTPPLNEHTYTFMQELAQQLSQGKTLVIHCRMGIGRAALVAAALLVLSGSAADVALRTIAAARGCAVPDTPEQAAWVAAFARYHRQATDVSS